MNELGNVQSISNLQIYIFKNHNRNKKKNVISGDFVFSMLSGIYFIESLDYLCSLEWGLSLFFGLFGLWVVVARCNNFFIFLQSYCGMEIHFHLVIGIATCGPFAYRRYDNKKKKSAYTLHNLMHPKTP
jgi:hypothetical protein